MKYKAIHILLGFLAVFGLLILSCEDNDQPVFGPENDPNPTGNPPPSVTEISPTQGFLKDVITIKGSGFQTTPEFNLVQFGNKVGTVNEASETELKVIAPNINDATVMVRVAKKGSEFWSNEVSFTFLATLETISEEINWANGVDVDDAGNVYVGAANDGVILKFAPDGSRSEFASVPVQGAIRFGPQGYLYVCLKNDGKVVRISPDGASIEDVVEVESPTSVDWDADGNTYIVSGDAGINVMDPGGSVTYLDLDGAPVKNCRVFDGYLYINRIWDGTITRFPISNGSLGAEEVYIDGSGDDYSPSSFDFDKDGVMYWSHAWDANLYTVNPDGIPGEILYEGQLSDPAESPLRYMTFHGKKIYAAFPGWADVGTVMSAYIGVEAAPNYGRGN